MLRMEVELLDPLTGIYSRASLKNRLQEEVDRSARYSQPFSIVLLDLDHFKSVNDAFGHRRGDDVLVTLAGRLREQIRKSDLVFRYGGDEFLLLLPGTEKASAEELAERLLTLLREKDFAGNPPLNLTSSMGIACFPEDAGTAEGLFDVADKRHYQAKRRGRNQSVSVDAVPSQDQPFDISLRVIDRENALDKVYTFFGALAHKKHGVLSITGPAGVGKSRFLEEVAKIARLHGHLTLQIAGRRALKVRSLGALFEAEQGWEGLPSIANGEAVFLRGLLQLIEDKGNIGVVFVIDNIHAIDRQSIAALKRIFYTPSLPHIAIAYSKNEELTPQLFNEAALVEVVALKPLTLEGVHVWLRHVLQWEAPPDFIAWLYTATGGLPEQLRISLNLLAEEGFLVKRDGWSLASPPGQGDFRNLPLAFWLQREDHRSKSRLPADLTTFVGRTNELRQLKRLLAQSHLVSLIGPGGIGKSRLALQAAIELEDDFAEGAFEVKLAGLDPLLSDVGESALYAGLADAIGIPLHGKEDIRVQLLRFLEKKRLLLVINDYEHFSFANPVLEDIIAGAPHVVLLLTSWEPSNLPGETVFKLGGLPVPEHEYTPGAQQFEAVQLFQTQAQRADQDFRLNERNIGPVIRVCRLVGGMPLGIELAAAWVSMFSPDELARRIEENYNILASAHPESSPEKQSIQAVFDHFWGLLSDREQSVLAGLSVFQHQFSGSAARQVADASPFFLGALTNRVFLVKSAEGFYRMHELLRQYAAEKLDSRPEVSKQSRLAHGTFYLRFLESQTLHLRGKRQKEARQAIDAAIENIRLAWTWAIEDKQYALLDASVEALYLFFEIQGHYREGDAFFNHTADLLLVRVKREDRLAGRVRARVRLRGAIFRWMLGAIQEAAATIEDCIRVARISDDWEELALGYEYLGWVYYDLGRPRDEILRLWQDSLSLFRAHILPWGISRLLFNLSFISPLEENHQLMVEKLEISTELGDLVGIADSLLSLGGIQDQLGRIEEARDNLARSLGIYEQFGHQDGTAFAHFGIGNVHLNQGLYENALVHFDKALQLFRQTGNFNGRSTTLLRLFRVSMALGDYARARESLNDSLSLETQAGSQIGKAYALNHFGELELFEGDLASARQYLEESQQIIEGALDEWGLGRVRASMARLLLEEGDPSAALRAAEEGLAASRSSGETAFIHAGMLAAGAALLALGDRESAWKYLLDALSLARQRRSPPMQLDSLLEIANFHRTGADGGERAAALYALIGQHPAAHNHTRRLAAEWAGAAQAGGSDPGALQRAVDGIVAGGADG